jgi:hypothetical protein
VDPRAASPLHDDFSLRFRGWAVFRPSRRAAIDSASITTALAALDVIRERKNRFGESGSIASRLWLADLEYLGTRPYATRAPLN